MAEDIGYAVNVDQKIISGRSINVQFNMPVGADEASWNTHLDLLLRVIDRQCARAELPALRQELVVKKRVAETIRTDINKLENSIDIKSKDSTLRNAPTQEVAAAAQQRESLKRVEKEIADFEKLLVELEKKAA